MQTNYKLLLNIITVLSVVFNSNAFSQNVLFTYGDNTVYSDQVENACTSHDIAFTDDFLENYIDYKLNAADAKRLKFDTCPNYVTYVKYYKNRLVSQYVAQSKAALNYKKDILKRSGVQFRVYGIRVEIENPCGDTVSAYRKAMNLRSRINSGAAFSTVAKQNSDDVSAAFSLGDFGWLSSGEMPGYNFENYVYGAELNHISMPIKSNNSYYLIKVSDKRKAVDSIVVNVIMNPVVKYFQKDDSLNTLFQNIYSELQKGAVLNTLALKHSVQDTFEIKLSAAEALDNFSCIVNDLMRPGDYTKPFVFNDNRYIVKLKRLVYRNTDDALKEKIDNNFYSDERFSICADRLTDSIKKVLNFQQLSDLSCFEATLGDSSVFRECWNYDLLLQPETPLFKLGSRIYSREDFAQFIIKTQVPMSPCSERLFINKRFNEFVDQSAYENAFEVLSVTNTDLYNKMENYSDEILNNLLIECLRKRYDSNNTNEIYNYYLSDTIKYMNYSEMYLQFYKYTSEKVRDKVLKSLESDININPEIIFNDSTRFYCAVADTFKVGQFSSADTIIKRFDQGIYNLPQNKFVVIESENYIVLCTMVKNRCAKPFEEVKSQVATDFSDAGIKNRHNYLRQTYNPVINTSEVERLKSLKQ